MVDILESGKKKEDVKKINCAKCKFYYITWDSRFPYGCRAIGFKGKEIPAVSVKRNTGIECQFYQERERSGK